MSDSIQLEFSAQIFEKYSNIKCNENTSIGIQVVACGQVDGHETHSRFSHFCLKVSVGSAPPYIEGNRQLQHLQSEFP